MLFFHINQIVIAQIGTFVSVLGLEMCMFIVIGLLLLKNWSGMLGKDNRKDNLLKKMIGGCSYTPIGEMLSSQCCLMINVFVIPNLIRQKLRNGAFDTDLGLRESRFDHILFG
jgi:hypothetical protein